MNIEGSDEESEVFLVRRSPGFSETEGEVVKECTDRYSLDSTEVEENNKDKDAKGTEETEIESVDEMETITDIQEDQIDDEINIDYVEEIEPIIDSQNKNDRVDDETSDDNNNLEGEELVRRRPERIRRKPVRYR